VKTINNAGSGWQLQQKQQKTLAEKELKSPYHGFLKMTVHEVWNIALRE